MGLLQNKDKKKIKDLFKQLAHEVTLVMFTQEMECELCTTTRELLQEVATLSEKIKLRILDFVADRDEAEKYHVDKIPAIVLLGDKDYGIRFFGIPAGYEFMSLLEDIVDVSRRDPSLPKSMTAKLAKVDQPIHLQVLVSPTCPHCPRAVRAAHRFAMASDFIRADMVEIAEFPHLVQKYDVQGVPRTIINETFHLVGALPDEIFLQEILNAVKKEKSN